MNKKKNSTTNKVVNHEIMKLFCFWEKWKREVAHPYVLIPLNQTL